MFSMKYVCYFIILHLIVGTPQINVHYTNGGDENESNNGFRHDCLRVIANIDEVNVNHQIISYCLSEVSSKFNFSKIYFY